MRLIILMLLSSGLLAQSSDIPEVEVTKKQVGPDVILMAKNHTDSTYIVTISVESDGMKLSRRVPFDVRLAGGQEMRLITLTPIPGKPWSYRQSYSYNPVPPPIPDPIVQTEQVSDVMMEVLEILNSEAKVERPNTDVEDPNQTIVEADPVNDHDQYEKTGEVRGVSLESEQSHDDSGYDSDEVPPSISTVTRSAYIPTSVSDEFSHKLVKQVFNGTPSPFPDDQFGLLEGAYIPISVKLELANNDNRAATTHPSSPVEKDEPAIDNEPLKSKIMTPTVLGLRTVAYKVPDIEAAKNWYSRAFGINPYFDEPFYVGFDIGGYELGLQPLESGTRTNGEGVISYWGVEDIETTYKHFLSLGASIYEAPQGVGGDIVVAAVKDPWGNIIGLIYNPDFKVK